MHTLQTTLQTRAAELIASGYRPVPVKEKQPAYAGDTSERDYAPEHFTDGMRIQVRAGLQKDGGYLYGYDLEGPSHGPTFNADREWAALEQALPHVARKLVRVRSTTGDGWWLIFRCHKTLRSGTLFQDGRKIGDFIGNGGTQRVPDFGESILQTLTLTEIQHLLDFWTVRSAVPDGESWTMRGRQGASYAAGYKRVRATKEKLCDFLITLNTKTSLRLADKLTTAAKGERSDLAGNLMQCLLFNIHKLTESRDFTLNCRTAMAYWMGGESYGKALDKDYSQEKDGFSLVAQIIHEDALQNGGKWTCPFWAKGQTTAAPAPTPEPEAPRPAHRPAGDREKHLATFRRVLEAIEPDEFGRRTYTLAYLAEKMKVARCEVKPRTIQDYLKQLRGDGGGGGEIVTAQINGNGTPYAILTCRFGGAIKSKKPALPVPESPAVGGANQIALGRIEMPETVDSSLQCIEDHQNPSAPVVELSEWAGIEEELAAFIPPAAAPPQIREWDRAESWAAAELSNERHVAAQALKPRQTVPPVEFSDLPDRPVLSPHWPDWVWGWDPPPQGRSSFGAPLSAPAGTAQPLPVYNAARLIEQLRARQEGGYG